MSPRPQKASVLVIVLVTIVFATTALIAFIEHASDDLMVPTRSAHASRLRAEAYSALETVLAVLVDFRSVNGALRSPNEPWGHPLELDWVAYTPAAEGRTVTVTFEDESGKLSLPTITDTNLTALLIYMGIDEADAALVKDSLFTWMKPGYTPLVQGATTPAQYLQEVVPFTPPRRSLRSWSELANIDGVREILYDANGRLNEYGKRFVADFSLYSFASPNVNGGKPDTLYTIAQMTEDQQQNVVSYLSGGATTGSGVSLNGRLPYFQNTADVTSVAQTLSAPAGLVTTISALRINVTVKQGLSIYTLSAVVSWPGTATVVAAPAPPTVATTANTASAVTNAPLAVVQLQYPYTILELTESDLDPSAQATDQTQSSDDLFNSAPPSP